MRAIRQIQLIQFRNYSTASFAFPTRITCITGPNGSGKTNLLDAVYYLCYTKSYFSAYQQHAAQSGTDGFRIIGTFEKDNDKEQVSCKWQAGKKEVQKDGIDYERITDHIGTWSAVMIAPDDTELINEHSELRRKWMDGILGQVDRTYLEKLMHYQRVLQQRNAWLKQQAFKPSADYIELEHYNSRLADDGTYIHEQRKQFLQSFLPLLEDFYHRISGGNEPVQVTYVSDLSSKPLATWLQQGLEYDLRYQRTLRGIHKDDWEFMLNGMALKQFGSQGQKKSFLFALKLAQYAWLAQTSGAKPILLLDDIFEKLDQSRMSALLRIICSGEIGQVLLTDTHLDRLVNAFPDGSETTHINLQPTV